MARKSKDDQIRELQAQLKQSRKRIIDHLCQVLPDVERSRIEKLI